MSDDVASQLKAWADRLCPEWAEGQRSTTEAARQSVTEARLLREAAALIGKLTCSHPFHVQMTAEGTYRCRDCGELIDGGAS